MLITNILKGIKQTKIWKEFLIDFGLLELPFDSMKNKSIAPQY